MVECRVVSIRGTAEDGEHGLGEYLEEFLVPLDSGEDLSLHFDSTCRRNMTSVSKSFLQFCWTYSSQWESGVRMTGL